MGKGQLVLKGGLAVTASGVAKKKSKKRGGKKEAPAAAGGDADAAGPSAPPAAAAAAAAPHGINVSRPDSTYEQEFATESRAAREGRAKATPWGSGYRQAPEILHGYDAKLTGKNATERLAMRAATKADKFC
jgi:hypothetical protein